MKGASIAVPERRSIRHRRQHRLHRHAFQRRLDQGYRVFAFEPEARNLRFFENVIRRRGLENRITIVPMARRGGNGIRRLWVNPGTHADHRILTDAFQPPDPSPVQHVPMTSIDDFVTHHPEASPVAFIKVDVQGFEEAVCRGMERTLRSHPDAVIAVEYFPEGLASLGFQPEAMLDFFNQRGYMAHRLSRCSGLTRIDPRELHEKLPAPGYMDLVYSRRALS